MTRHEARSDAATLADEAQARTTAPTAEPDAHHAHGHDDHDHAEHDHEHEHAFEWQEALRIGLVALAAALVWFRVWEPLSQPLA